MERLNERLLNLKKGVESMTEPEIKVSKLFLESVCEYMQKLKEYKDLEEKIGIPLSELVELCDKCIPDECKNPSKAIVLTDEDVDKWQQYKEFEEQKAKKVIIIGYNNSIGTDIGICPVCDRHGLRGCDNKYCPECGHKLDWGL